MRGLARLHAGLRRRVVDRMTTILTQPLRTYEQHVPNSLRNLKEYLRPGDVILVEGDQRISQVIRYLTQSSWSHSALYLGDEMRRVNPPLAQSLTARFGDEAKHLVIEAEARDGVVCSPIAKYVNHNLRVCRPHGLRREDLDKILAEVIGQLGRHYSVRHILDLGRYFFPVTLIPQRFRRAALHFGGATTRRVICSTMLARAFAHVGYPILPRVTIDQIAAQTHWLNRVLGRNGHSTRALYRERDLALITPRDFDLSPYFEIVKFNHLAGGRFDYRRIEWANGDTPIAAGEKPSVVTAVARSKVSAA